MIENGKTNLTHVGPTHRANGAEINGDNEKQDMIHRPIPQPHQNIRLGVLAVVAALGVATSDFWIDDQPQDIAIGAAVPTIESTNAQPAFAHSREHQIDGTTDHAAMVAANDDELPETVPTIIEPDVDTAPPEADDALADDDTIRAAAEHTVVSQSEYVATLNDVANNIDANNDAAVDRAWAYAIDHHRERELISALRPRLQSQNPAIVEHSQEAIAALSEPLNNPEKPAEQQASAAETDEYVANLTRTALTDAEPEHRFEAIAELGSHPRADAISALRRAVNDPDTNNRNQAVLSLASIAATGTDRESIRALLLQTMYSGDSQITATAEQALKSLDQI